MPTTHTEVAASAGPRNHVRRALEQISCPNVRFTADEALVLVTIGGLTRTGRAGEVTMHAHRGDVQMALVEVIDRIESSQIIDRLVRAGLVESDLNYLAVAS